MELMTQSSKQHALRFQHRDGSRRRCRRRYFVPGCRDTRPQRGEQVQRAGPVFGHNSRTCQNILLDDSCAAVYWVQELTLILIKSLNIHGSLMVPAKRSREVAVKLRWHPANAMFSCGRFLSQILQSTSIQSNQSQSPGHTVAYKKRLNLVLHG